MFHKVTLKNFRTHQLTTIDLHPITLLIGNNNSGKTNLLAGIQHFCGLIMRGNPDIPEKSRIVVASKDIDPYRYRLAKDEESMEFSTTWSNQLGQVTYSMELLRGGLFNEDTICREKIDFRLSKSQENKSIESGVFIESNVINLRKTIENDASLSFREKKLCNLFFLDAINTFTYYFQPDFLKGLFEFEYENDKMDYLYGDLKLQYYSGRIKMIIPLHLGRTGINLQKMIKYVKEKDERTFARFTALMRRFDPTFQGVRYDERPACLVWEFDLGRKGIVEEFLPDVLSDGFMKAAAMSLLASLQRPPAMILLEEIENGINPANIQELMRWLWQMTSPNSEGYASQFIITSHSPSVLREFHDRLNCVYTVRLDKRRKKSDVRNLNSSLDTLVGIGTVDGEIIERDGKRFVELPKYELAELWYSGTIG